MATANLKVVFLSLVIVLGITACVAESPGLPGNILEQPVSAEQAQADEILYLQRIAGTAERFRLRPRDGGYDPLVPVSGAADWRPLPEAAPDQRTINPEALDAVEAYAQAGNSDVLVVWRKGRIELARYWNEYTVDEPMISYSLAKPLTAIAVGRALAAGHIQSLQQPVADFLPEWRGTERAGIMVRHLLDMRSGLLPQANGLEPGNLLQRAYLHPRHEEIIINRYPLTHVPGTRYEYNNATAELVSPVIERATAVRYEEWVAEKVLKPIGALGGRVWLNRPGGVAHSGCCILLPAETFLRLAILLIQDGMWDGKRLLPENYVDTMRTATPQNPWAGMAVYVAGQYVDRRGAANPEISAGKTLHSEPYLAADLFLFDGNNNQTVHIVPSEELIVLRLGPRPPKDPEWDNAYLPNTLIRGIIR